MIELVNVSKVYQETHALKNIHFSVQPGEIVGIVGKSGSGKSTLLRLLNLMEQPSEGRFVLMAEMFKPSLKRSSPAATTNGDGVSALQFVRKFENL